MTDFTFMVKVSLIHTDTCTCIMLYIVLLLYTCTVTQYLLLFQNTSYMFVTGPKVVEEVTMEKVTELELGGAVVHTKKSGLYI